MVQPDTMMRSCGAQPSPSVTCYLLQPAAPERWMTRISNGNARALKGWRCIGRSLIRVGMALKNNGLDTSAKKITE